MNAFTLSSPAAPRRALLVASALVFSFAGCRSNPAGVSDDALASSVMNQISADSALGGQPVQVQAKNGIITLNGTVANDAQRTIAARDAAGVSGVKEVIDNITVGASAPPASASVTSSQPAAVPAPTLKRNESRDELRNDSRLKPSPIPPPHEPAPISRPPQVALNNSAPPAPVAPPPPPAPVFKTLTIPTGESVPVRITQTLDSASTQEGSSFSGTVASDILVDGIVAIPAGATVSGRVDEVHDATHFKGSSSLTVSLASINHRGEHIPVTSDPYTVQGKGRGTNTAEKVGGGAAVGAILGGIFGGGKGAAIGAAAGGGTGAGVQAISRGQQVQIASESIVRFKLETPVTIRVRVDGGSEPRHDGLQQRTQP